VACQAIRRNLCMPAQCAGIQHGKEKQRLTRSAQHQQPSIVHWQGKVAGRHIGPSASKHSPGPFARPETPSAMASQLARMTARAARDDGMRSPRASRPTSTPVTMLLTAAQVHTTTVLPSCSAGNNSRVTVQPCRRQMTLRLWLEPASASPHAACAATRATVLISSRHSTSMPEVRSLSLDVRPRQARLYKTPAV